MKLVSETTKAPYLIRRSQLKNLVGLSPSNVDRLEKAGAFPARRRVGPGCVGWLSSEVEDFLSRCSKVEKTDAK